MLIIPNENECSVSWGTKSEGIRNTDFSHSYVAEEAYDKTREVHGLVVASKRPTGI